MNKFLLGFVVAVVLVLPANSVLAENNSEEQYRSILIQLIISLQKQIASLTSGQLQTSATNSVDRCPNIAGVQNSTPDGFVYSSTLNKCVTEEYSDKLEARAARPNKEERICQDKKSQLSNARKTFAEQEDFVDFAKSQVPKQDGSYYERNYVDSSIESLRSHSRLGDQKGSFYDSLEEIIAEENKIDEMQKVIVRAEFEKEEACEEN